MNKRTSILLGGLLIVVGILSLIANLLGPLVGWRIWWWVPWRLWPLLVIGAGLVFVLPPFTVKGKRGLGGLFIVGIPTMAIGGILLFTSMFNVWGAWSWLWPVTVWSVALGFLMMAAYMRNIWLLIPAIIIGTNGLLFQFCALTGWWHLWVVLWAFEPFSVGLSFLLIYLGTRRSGLLVAGLILCGVAATGLILTSALLPERWLLGMFGPALLIFTGLLVLFFQGRSRIAEKRVVEG